MLADIPGSRMSAVDFIVSALVAGVALGLVAALTVVQGRG